MELIKYPSPNYGLRRDDTKIEFIILHYTAMGIENSLDRLCDPTHEVSCHYLIDQGGLCYQLVDDSKRAWHCLLYTSPSPRDGLLSRMPSSA